MVKEPRPGRVKTRLAQDVGAIEATRWFRHQLRQVLRRLRDPRWQIILAVAPDAAGQTSRMWPADLARFPQGRGDLGVRMRRALNGVAGPVCLIGGDIPAVEPAHIARAFRALRSSDVVFGPAEDGGFWLVGRSARQRLAPCAFAGVTWSTSTTLTQSQHSLRGLRVAHVDLLWDVDTGADLQRARDLSIVA